MTAVCCRDADRRDDPFLRRESISGGTGKRRDAGARRAIRKKKFAYSPPLRYIIVFALSSTITVYKNSPSFYISYVHQPNDQGLARVSNNYLNVKPSGYRYHVNRPSFCLCENGEKYVAMANYEGRGPFEKRRKKKIAKLFI